MTYTNLAPVEPSFCVQPSGGIECSPKQQLPHSVDVGLCSVELEKRFSTDSHCKSRDRRLLQLCSVKDTILLNFNDSCLMFGQLKQMPRALQSSRTTSSTLSLAIIPSCSCLHQGFGWYNTHHAKATQALCAWLSAAVLEHCSVWAANVGTAMSLQNVLHVIEQMHSAYILGSCLDLVRTTCNVLIPVT